MALDRALLTAEMFVAFSKKSPCRSLVEGFGKGITEMTTDGRFDAMLTDAQKAYANQSRNATMPFQSQTRNLLTLFDLF